MLTQFDVSTTGEGERFSYWREEICRNYCRSDSEMLQAQPFKGHISRNAVGPIELSEVRCEAVRYEREASDLKGAPCDDFLLSLLIAGQGQLEQSGRQAMQGTGDIVIYDTASCFTYSFPEQYQLVLLKVPRRMMLSRVPQAERLTAMLISGQTPVGRLAAGMMRDVACTDLEDAAAGKIAASLVDVVSAAIDVELAGRCEHSQHQDAHLKRAQDFMRANLDDCDMDVESIARALYMSTSKLGRLFASNGTTVMRWLLKERLEASRRALMEGRASQVTEAAMSCGFSSFSHFSRTFKSVYGQSPHMVMRSNAR